MFAKLISIFSSKSSKKEAPKRPKPNTANKKKNVDPTRIGGLGEYKIDIQLSQVPKPAKYLNDLMLANPKRRSGYSQIDHVLVTGYGIFVIEAKNYSGTIKGRKQEKQWRVNGKFPMKNPLHQNFGHIQAIKSVLNEYPTLRYISIITFNRRCTFSMDREVRIISSDELVVYDTEFTDYVQRKLARLKLEGETAVMDEPAINNIIQLITAANITDPSIRAEHINKANPKK